MRADGIFLQEVLRDFQVFDLSAPRIRNVPIALFKYLRLRKPSVLMANMWPLTSAAIISNLLYRFRVRIVVVDHCLLSIQYSSRKWKFNILGKISIFLTYRMADWVVGVSVGVKDDLEAISGVGPGRFRVIYNAVPSCPVVDDVELLHAESLWGCPKGERILTIGNFKPEKNHLLLLEAFARLPRPDSRLMFVGAGETEQYIRSLSADLGLSHRVIFAGFRSYTWPFYLTSDLFVLSSDYEGLGNVLVEALSAGLRVVSTDCPTGPREVLDNGNWGRLTPVGDVDSLSQAINDSLNEPAVVNRLITRSKEFAPDVIARQYLDLFLS